MTNKVSELLKNKGIELRSSNDTPTGRRRRRIYEPLEEPEKNRKQSGKILEKNRKQSGKILEKNRKQSGKILERNWKNTGTQTGNETGKELEKNWKNTGKKLEKFSGVLTLTGVQRKIIDFFYHESLRTDDRSTPPMSLSLLGKMLNKRSANELESIRKTVYALQQKELVTRLYSKHGPGGFTKYKLSESVIRELRDLEIWKNTGKEPEKYWKETGTHTGTHTGKMAPSSSSDLITNKTTTTSELPDEWKSVQVDALAHTGFSESHLLQLFRQGLLNTAEVQQSIDAFAFDLSINSKAQQISGRPLNYFMGILRKGPYTPPPNYETPEDKQAREYAEFLERQAVKRRETEQRQVRAVVEIWWNGLSDHAKEEIAPLGSSQERKLDQAVTHFATKLTPEDRERVVGEIATSMPEMRQFKLPNDIAAQLQ